MPTIRRLSVVALCLCVAGVIRAPDLHAQQPATETPTSAKTWLDRRQALEDYLRIADVIKMEEIGVGVTRPRRAYLAPGGLVDRMAWKTITPGLHEGFWESYKSEIAAYELDKLLGLDMIPPTVERRVKGDLGAAIMWVSPTKELQGAWRPSKPTVTQGRCMEPAARSREDVRQPHLQYRSKPRELARRPILEPDPDRSHPLVHSEKGHGPPDDAH